MKKERRKMARKKGIALDFLGWLIIGVAVLVIILVVYFIISGKGIGAIEKIINLFRFGR